MEEHGGSLPSFLSPAPVLQLLELLLLATTLLLLFAVDDSGSAMTVDVTKAVSLIADAAVDTVPDIVGDKADDDDDDDGINVTVTELRSSSPSSVLVFTSFLILSDTGDDDADQAVVARLHCEGHASKNLLSQS